MKAVKMTVNEPDKKVRLESVVTFDDPDVGTITIHFNGFLPGVKMPGPLDPDSADVGDLTITVTAPVLEEPLVYIIDTDTGQWTLDK